MTHYVAFLRGVSPMNAKMPELKRAFEAAGFTDVKTVLSSGNVVFGARAAAVSTLERKCEQAMEQALGRSFATHVRPVQALRALRERDPFGAVRLPAEAKRVVTFLRRPPAQSPRLPLEMDGARIVALADCEVFSAYVPGPRGPVFMTLIEKTFGKDVTTRTWDTVGKCVAAAGG
jgi:uncharacterized protein (DUF1697 family)